MVRNAGFAFSPVWVLVSYFLTCGGLVASVAGYAAAGARDQNAGYAAFFVGAAVGGFLAGRASPHRSYAEPALAAALVVASVLLFARSTPMGKMAMAYARDEIWRNAIIAAGLGFAGAFFGAVVGEATQPRDPGVLPLRWLLLGIFISAGALFAAGTAAAILLLNDAAEAALSQMWSSDWQGGLDPTKPLVSEDRIVVAAAVSAASAALVGGFVTQLGAPRRMLLASAGGAALVLAGALLAIAAAVHRTREVLGAALLLGAAAGAVALVSALVAYLIYTRRR